MRPSAGSPARSEVTADGTVHRELDWARVSGGRELSAGAGGALPARRVSPETTTGSAGARRLARPSTWSRGDSAAASKISVAAAARSTS
jgi:hypothetical protein